MGKKNKRKILKNVLPNVSIVTPTFNRVKFLKILHNCILNQNYPLNKLEWIIVDGQNNNNKLNEVPLLINNLRKISNLKIIYFSLPMDENNKLGALRNKTNELSSGNIIVCMDDDDYYPPNRVINAVKGLNFGQLDLAGISKLYIYDFYLDNVIEFGPLHKNHSTNNGLAYTKNYTKKFKYKNDDSISEEIHFLNIDIEGLEDGIIKSLLEKKIFPWCIAIEELGKTYENINKSEIKKFLNKKGYFLASRTFLTSIYIKKNILKNLPSKYVMELKLS